MSATTTNVRQQLREQLQRLQNAPAAPGQPRHLRLPLDEGQVRLDIGALGPLACGFDSLSFETSRLAGADPQRLRQISDRLRERLTYLLEPVRAVESDGELGMIQMRSDPPSRDEERGRSYYELLVRRGGSLQLTRFRKLPGQPRVRVAAEVTREVLERLVHDLVNAVD